MHVMRIPVLAYGFRPFFLLAGIAGVLLIPLWVAGFAYGTSIGSSWQPTLWHAHEMLFGFAASAVAGFLLTAVPSWTGQKGFSGWPLLVLSLIWMTARMLIATSGYWPAGLVAAVDLAFLPALGLLVAVPLLRARNRNTILLIFLALLCSVNAIFHVALAHGDAPRAMSALRFGIDLLLVMVTLIGGRIVPVFTTSALRSQGSDRVIRQQSWLSALATAMMVLVALSDVAFPDSGGAALIAAAAAVVQAARLAQWGGRHTFKQPIVWVLHLAYLWIPVGLALKALALSGGFAFAAFWLHALTAGALATMILAVMTRASLGHTGRPLKVDPLIATAYGLLTGAAAVRAFGLSLLGLPYPLVIVIAAILWTAAFILFLAVYAPILTRPRVDGKPG
jgi:uncharacterized protein involved in response to NO